jgi:hypothetical protein
VYDTCEGCVSLAACSAQDAGVAAVYLHAFARVLALVPWFRRSPVLEALARLPEDDALSPVVTLSAEAWEQVMDMIANPPEPSEALRKLMRGNAPASSDESRSVPGTAEGGTQRGLSLGDDGPDEPSLGDEPDQCGMRPNGRVCIQRPGHEGKHADMNMGLVYWDDEVSP